jgi:hypothetical protein
MPRPTPTRRRTRPALLAAAATLTLVLAASAHAAEPWPGADYQASRAGHPLRILAYAAHPFGVAVDYLILRPCYWVGQREPMRTIFGVRPR